MTTTLTPRELRVGLLKWAARHDPHVRHAVELLAEFNHGRILNDPEWLAAFAAVSPSGVWLSWDDLDTALNGDDDAPEDHRFAVLAFSTSEKSVMRFACDLGMNRWRTAQWDPHTTAMVSRAFVAGVARPW